MFYDDYLSLADDETTFGAKSDNHLKVYIRLHIRFTSLDSSPTYIQYYLPCMLPRGYS